MEVESARCFNRVVVWLDPLLEYPVRTVPLALVGERCLSRGLKREKGEANVSKKRGVLVWCLFGLATILMFVSSLTIWSKRQLLDDQAWADSSTQLLANDETRGAIAQQLSDALFQRIDVEAQLRERLPRAQGAAPALAATLENTVGPAAADRLLQRPGVQTLWENLNERALAAVVKVLEGEDLGKNGNISTANGEVTLDLRPAITRLATRLGVEDKLKASADPSAGQLIMKSDQLGAAQTAVKILKALSSLLLIAVFALYALAIYLARGRRRLLLGATGASLVFVGLVIASLRHFLGGVIVDSLVKTQANKHPVSVIWAIETSVLRDIAMILVLYGALVLMATVLAGPNRPAVAIRRWLAPSFKRHPIVVWLTGLAVFLILLTWGPAAGDRRFLGVALLAATTAIAVEALRRQTLREFPDDRHPAVGKASGGS